MTLPLTLLALFFLLYTLLNWGKAFWYDRILIFYVLVFYFAVELSPTKPFPDFMRYVIPIVPVLLYFSWRGVEILFAWLKFKKARMVFASLVVIACLWPFYESLQLVYHLNHDTREKANRWVKETQAKVRLENYTGLDKDVGSLSSLNIPVERRQGITHLVASSFMYDRYVYGNKLKNQDETVYEIYKKYEELFSYPFFEIRPTYKSFAFSNPTIRVIDIRVQK